MSADQTQAPTGQLTVTVVVITYRRPDYVETCLTHLRSLTTPVEQVVVVDSAPAGDTASEQLVAERFPEVEYVRSGLPKGTMPEARQLGFARATGDVVAFIDDDSFVYPQWRDELVKPYADPAVAAVGGRAINGTPGEEVHGVDRIGRLLPDGELTGNFAADPGRSIPVDHLLGANMSFRRAALAEIGGIRGNYPGTCLREESDISLRLRARGHRLVYAPAALVHHVGAPYRIGGQRFDRRYIYYARRNHVMLLARVYGLGSPLLRRYTASTLRAQRAYVGEIARIVAARADAAGRTPSLRRRVTAPLTVASRVAAELAGFLMGWPAAIRARAIDRRRGVATP
ncbi:glycosyltransferase family 2 protein [Gryllotalpicola ginsengisoli]|uniref:glycosyltransferase family 2 protein n=1 Tax=Gryllotalpicola ginsengisoli TaxID=444608 RepID=UPI0003B5D057|nr:glycosyltransferase family 2 protein [Gryllotalpicola ginsengisoli]